MMTLLQSLPISLQTVLLLVASNVFMTFAWYGHLRHLGGRSWIFAAVTSWGIALFEYLLQVPANRIGYSSGDNRAVEAVERAHVELYRRRLRS